MKITARPPLIKPINPIVRLMLLSDETNNRPQVIKNKKKANDRKKVRRELKGKKYDIYV